MQHSNKRKISGRDDSTTAFTRLADLASARTGGRVLAASDDFFAPKANLIKPAAPIFVPDRYTTRGKWMDGWESRRRRTPGHDWCIVQLGMRGRIRGVNVDTSFFTGNYPTHGSIDAIDTPRPLPSRLLGAGGPPWTTVLAKTALNGDAHNYIPVTDDRPWTHVRLNIYPDGGVARLRVYGDVEVDWDRAAPPGRVVDLAFIRHGGIVLAVSDMHYGAKDNMLMPGRAKDMRDGWETRRRRGPGHDWAIVRLGAPGEIRRIEIDTNHFKGNYPDRASVEGCLAPGADVEALQRAAWTELLPESKLHPHHRHIYHTELRRAGPVSHVRLNTFPDGGVSRLRVHGTVADTR
jgi:allantoicase